MHIDYFTLLLISASVEKNNICISLNPWNDIVRLPAGIFLFFQAKRCQKEKSDLVSIF